MTTGALRLATVLAASLALAACGGDQGGTGAPGGSDTRPLEERGSYLAAYELCQGGLEVAAAAYAVDAEREQVVAIVTEQLAGGAPDEEEAARRGCEDALDDAEQGGGADTGADTGG